ncbi:MAG: PorT family protein, partial [Bacteroidetes bacterium]|nr:PorT family protein [Bacteroidota bacterium]
PVASFIVNKDIKIDGQGAKISDDALKDALWGLQFGAGIDVLMFTLDFRYELGLSDFYKGDNGTDYNFKNDLFKISLGWKIL